MPLAAGHKLAHYEILEPIGKGGMGEVYRARDTKLDRDVAIKVLPEEFANDEERLARFEREAKLLASLNHPNIATLHGLEECDGQQFLVMELVEGETLAERITAGPIPLEEIVGIFGQIAAGLGAAHEHGVIHRDLKPANIMLGTGGPKVVDFGLARTHLTETERQNLSESPTVTKETATGVILGTAPYMSPEQARGQHLDRRSDIWAFGCCLYEALAGQPAFLGDTLSDTIAKILTSEPDWSTLPSNVPVSIGKLLHRCLAKQPEQRLHDISDARLELEDTTFGEHELSGSKRASSIGVGSRALLPWTLFGLTAIVATIVIVRTPPKSTSQVMRARVILPETHDARTLSVLSPDGSQVVYEATEGDQRRLYVRRLDDGVSAGIVGTESSEALQGSQRPSSPFFSPDGQWVGFFDTWAGQLKKTSLEGVGAIDLVEVPAPRGGDWGPDGTIVYGVRRGGLRVVSEDGGASEELTTLDEGERSHRWPQLLRNGTAVLFISISGQRDTDKIMVQSLKTGERRDLATGSYARYVPTGHLVFTREQTLFAMPFDLDRLQVRGTATPVQRGVASPRGVSGSRGDFSFSGTGTLVYRPRVNPSRQLALVDRRGNQQPLPAPLMSYDVARFAPDGRHVAVSTMTDGNVHLYEMEQNRLTELLVPFEDETGTRWQPKRVFSWSPNGGEIGFLASSSGRTSGDFFVMPVNRGGDAIRHVFSLEGGLTSNVVDWSPDGQRLLYVSQEGNVDYDIAELPLRPEGSPTFLVQSSSRDWSPAYSPDGHWIAYGSDASGRHEVYVMPVDRSRGARQVSIDGGFAPTWSPTGRAIYYRNGEEMMMTLSVTTEPVLSAGPPQKLFAVSNWQRASSLSSRSYDISPDGEQFVLILGEDESAASHLHLIVNWFEELKRLVPTDD